MTEPTSKSALKREATRLQQLGLALTKLKPDVRANFDLPDKLREAIDVHARISSREGSRRQMQFIGRLMRKLDTEQIEQQLADLKGESAAARSAFHQLETWRDRLIHDPALAADFISLYPHADRQQLRHLTSKAQKSLASSTDNLSDLHKRNARALFRFLRETAEQS